VKFAEDIEWGCYTAGSAALVRKLKPEPICNVCRICRSACLILSSICFGITLQIACCASYSQLVCHDTDRLCTSRLHLRQARRWRLTSLARAAFRAVLLEGGGCWPYPRFGQVAGLVWWISWDIWLGVKCLAEMPSFLRFESILVYRRWRNSVWLGGWQSEW